MILANHSALEICKVWPFPFRVEVCIGSSGSPHVHKFLPGSSTSQGVAQRRTPTRAKALRITWTCGQAIREEQTCNVS